MYNNITRIESSKFKQKYDIIKKDKIPDIISQKALKFLNNYSCFNSLYDPKMIWEKKKFSKKEKQSKNRFHIIIPDFTDSSIAKRQLMGNLNKLTTKNKNVIYEKIKDIIVENNTIDYFEIIWSYIKTTDDNLYFDILQFFNESFLNTMIDEKWKKYNEDKEWMPQEYILVNNMLFLDDEYDMYCNYVKWKKEVNCINMTWIKLKKNLNNLLEDILAELIRYIHKEGDIYKHVIDIFLEQINKILKEHHNDDIVNAIRDLDIALFDNSSRFLIYDIIKKK